MFSVKPPLTLPTPQPPKYEAISNGPKLIMDYEQTTGGLTLFQIWAFWQEACLPDMNKNGSNTHTNHHMNNLYFLLPFSCSRIEKWIIRRMIGRHSSSLGNTVTSCFQRCHLNPIHILSCGGCLLSPFHLDLLLVCHIISTVLRHAFSSPAKC